MEVIIFGLILWAWLTDRFSFTKRRVSRKWVATFKGKRTVPMTVYADTDGLALRELMRAKVDYQTIASLELA